MTTRILRGRSIPRHPSAQWGDDGSHARRDVRRAGRATALARLLAATALLGAAACSAGSGGTSGEAGGGADSTGSGGEVVAVLETAASERKAFILRGTVPVPPGVYPRRDKKVPFSVLDWDGRVRNTQMEVVSWYPRTVDGADVVEVLAMVHPPPGTPVGSRLQYQVVENPHPKLAMKVHPQVEDLLSRPGAVLLVGRDVFGNQYGVDLWQNERASSGSDRKTFRKGHLAETVRTHGAMVPVGASLGPPSGALPHLFGVHAYFTAWHKSSALSLTLRIHNGLSGLDKSDAVDDPLGKVYFESLELWVPKGWQVLNQTPDPAMGAPRQVESWTAFPLVKARTDGKMHSMPSQAQFHRRLALAPTGRTARARAILAEEGLAFCQPEGATGSGEPYSWWNPRTARYFPQNHRLPELDHVGAETIRNKHAIDLANLSNLIETGTAGNYPMINPAMGWAHPWGVAYCGMTGGSEIFLFDGVSTAWAASRDGYRHYQLVHRMYTDRQPDVLFNKDGEPTSLPQWVTHGPSFDYVHMLFFQKLIGGHDPFGFDQAPTFQRDWVASHGLRPGYEATLDGFMPIDFQHYTRATRAAKVLAWLGNDALSRDDLLMRAELLRLSYHMMPNGPGGGAIVSGMLADWESVQEHPGQGFAFGRGEAWGLDAVNCAYALADRGWRQGIRSWYEDIADLVCQGQASCSGFIQAIISVKMLGGEYHTRQSIEQSITENALKGMLETVLRGADAGRTEQIEFVLAESTRAMIGPMAWDSSIRGPWNYLAVGPKDKNQGVYCGGIPSGAGGAGADKFQIWSSFAYGYELTGDSQFLDRAAEALGGGDLHTLVHASYLDNLENKAALLALVQELY